MTRLQQCIDALRGLEGKLYDRSWIQCKDAISIIITILSAEPTHDEVRNAIAAYHLTGQYQDEGIKAALMTMLREKEKV